MSRFSLTAASSLDRPGTSVDVSQRYSSPYHRGGSTPSSPAAASPWGGGNRDGWPSSAARPPQPQYSPNSSFATLSPFASPAPASGSAAAMNGYRTPSHAQPSSLTAPSPVSSTPFRSTSPRPLPAASPPAAAASVAPSNGNLAAAPSALSSRFSDPTIDSIAAQLHQVQQYKTPGNLVAASACLLVGVTTILYMLIWPMMPRVSFLGGLLSVSREHLQLVGLIIGGWMAYVGALRLHRYHSLQLPLRALEGLSERQKQLMGWSASGSAASAAGRAAAREDERATVERNLRRRRAQNEAQAQIKGTSTPAAMPPRPHTSQQTPHGRSPVPTASLRFLDQTPPSSASASRFGGGGLFSSSHDRSPFRTRGLDSNVHDESSLQNFASSYASRRAVEEALQTPPPSGAAARYGAGISPRGFVPAGFGGGYGAVSALNTPPYASSLREAAVAPVVSTPSALGGSAAGAAAPAFLVPGVRYSLEDPRADAELHDAFAAQLRTSLRRSTQELDGDVRRMRAWIAVNVLRPFLRALDASDAQIVQLARAAIAHTANQAGLWTPDALALVGELVSSYDTAAAQGLPPQRTARAEEAIDALRSRFPQRPEIVARAAVDAVLAVPQSATTSGSTSSTTVAPSAATKAYVARRLAQLCAPGDDSLSKYSVQPSGVATGTVASPYISHGLFGPRASPLTSSPFLSSGSGLGAANQSTSSGAFPSDAQILLHAFCAHMESVVSGFARQYVRDVARDPIASGSAAAALPRPTDGAACIVQVRPAHLPAYYLVARAPAAGRAPASQSPVKYVTEPGRASLFQALVLWTMELPVGSRLGREFTGISNDA